MHQPPFPSGQLVTHQGTDPAAGANFTLDVPEAKRWHVVSVQFRLVTDANAANRVCLVTGGDGTNAFCTSNVSDLQTANLTIDYHVSRGLNNLTFAPTGALAGKRFSALAHDMWLRGLAGASDNINIQVGNIQVGDQLSLIVIRFFEYSQAPQV
jgi:hypothetical protein